MNKKGLIFSLTTIIICIILTFLVNKNEFLLTFINLTFIVGLIYVLIGGTLLVIESGFFNLTRYGFKKLVKTTKKQEVIEQFTEEEKVSEDIIFQKLKFSTTKVFLYNGLFLTIATTLLSFIYIA